MSATLFVVIIYCLFRSLYLLSRQAVRLLTLEHVQRRKCSCAQAQMFRHACDRLIIKNRFTRAILSRMKKRLLRFESSNRSRAGLITYFRQASPLAKPPYRITSRSTVRSHRPPRTTGQCRHAPTSPIRAPNAPTAGLDYISIHVVTTVSDGQTRFRGHPRSSSQG
jgi:hypothetical protein